MPSLFGDVLTDELTNYNAQCDDGDFVLPDEKAVVKGRFRYATTEVDAFPLNP